jgi:hypothetical protein
MHPVSGSIAANRELSPRGQCLPFPAFGAKQSNRLGVEHQGLLHLPSPKEMFDPDGNEKAR